eukprot:11762877-Alexandrium_andersonii.AAC.1
MKQEAISAEKKRREARAALLRSKLMYQKHIRELQAPPDLIALRYKEERRLRQASRRFRSISLSIVGVGAVCYRLREVTAQAAERGSSVAQREASDQADKM